MTPENQKFVIEQLKWALERAKGCGDYNAVASITQLLAQFG